VQTTEQKDALIAALMIWVGENEGIPSNIADAELMKAVWAYDGDRTDPCPECDGECDEPCRPTTVAEACASLDAWIAQRRSKLAGNHPFAGFAA
jgi:hypothetical protein